MKIDAIFLIQKIHRNGIRIPVLAIDRQKSTIRTLKYRFTFLLRKLLLKTSHSSKSRNILHIDNWICKVTIFLDFSLLYDWTNCMFAIQLQVFCAIFASKFGVMYEILSLINAMSPFLLLGFFLAGVMHAFVPNKLYNIIKLYSILDKRVII